MSDITIYVDPEGNAGHNSFYNIMDAVASIEKDNKNFVTICISPGIYNERVEIRRPHTALKGMGEHPSDTVITASFAAKDKLPDGSLRGTFRSYTMLLNADDISLSNLTVKNESGEPLSCGQAVALYAEGDSINVTGCRLESRQDTLFTGPLPPREIQPGGFTGPTQNAPRRQGHQRYKDCFISGDVDFIFGSAAAVFEDCELCSLIHRPGRVDADTVQGYVTAPSTPEGAEKGYEFIRCRFTSEGLLPGTAYLSRPWRNFACAHFEDCEIGEHIRGEGFHDWDKPQAHATVRYTVKDCRRPDGSPFIPTAPFSSVL